MTQTDPFQAERHRKFTNSITSEYHKTIRDEIVSELHLDFERRNNGMHAVCMLCRGSVARLTQHDTGHEIGYVYTLDTLASLFMAHFMQRHYEQEGRTCE